MCGRFALFTPTSRIAEVFEILDPPELELSPRYNVAPTDPVLTIIERGTRRMGMMRWGLVPWFQKGGPKAGPPQINARSETVHEKPAFRQAFEARRCIVPADGFYEWKKDGKARHPSLFRRRDHELLAMAGLWDTWKDESGQKLASCTVLTCGPNALVEPLHDRMPVILRRELWAPWLLGEGDFAEWRPRFAPLAADEMERLAVSQRVNSVKNDDPSCLDPA